jgi:hypothetical protein
MKIREITRLNEAVSLRPDPARVREIVLKQLPRYAGKAVPIAGWAYMFYDLYVRLALEKDYKGAVMSLTADAATIGAQVGGTALGGPVVGAIAGISTQLAGIAALLARDTYGMMFCLDPKTKTPMLCPPGEARHGMSLQWEDDQYPGYKERREMWLGMIEMTLEDLKQSIDDALPDSKNRITGKQGADNARKAVRDFDTPNNPSPYLHPERYPK